MESEMKNVIVGQSGGPTSVINSSLLGVYKTAKDRGLCVIIAAAGGAAHLAGVLAAGTVLPVIGIPVAGGALNGLDALYATVQMPGGVPVACVAVGSAGPVNAALLAVQMLALAHPEIKEKLANFKKEIANKIAKDDAEMQKMVAEI